MIVSCYLVSLQQEGGYQIETGLLAAGFTDFLFLYPFHLNSPGCSKDKEAAVQL